MSPHDSLALSQMREAYFHTGFEVLLAEIPDALLMAIGTFAVDTARAPGISASSTSKPMCKYASRI